MDQYLAATASLLGIIALACGGVWVVASIKSATSNLGQAIRSLSGTIEDLKEQVKELKTEVRKLDGKLNEHAVKIGRLEGHEGGPQQLTRPPRRS